MRSHDHFFEFLISEIYFSFYFQASKFNRFNFWQFLKKISSVDKHVLIRRNFSIFIQLRKRSQGFRADVGPDSDPNVSKLSQKFSKILDKLRIIYSSFKKSWQFCKLFRNLILSDLKLLKIFRKVSIRTCRLLCMSRTLWADFMSIVYET